MKNACSLFLLLSLIACSRAIRLPLVEAPTQNNPTYQISYLFEHDGCKVYRFYDNGNMVYFTNCQGETISFPDSSTVIRNSINLKKDAP